MIMATSVDADAAVTTTFVYKSCRNIPIWTELCRKYKVFMNEAKGKKGERTIRRLVVQDFLKECKARNICIADKSFDGKYSPVKDEKYCLQFLRSVLKRNHLKEKKIKECTTPVPTALQETTNKSSFTKEAFQIESCVGAEDDGSEDATTLDEQETAPPAESTKQDGTISTRHPKTRTVVI